MIFDIFKSIQARRAAARNYRVLSTLDDAALCDVGLDRRTLRAFCDNGCRHYAAIKGKPGAQMTSMPANIFTPALH
jgi:hypothetical protein